MAKIIHRPTSAGGIYSLGRVYPNAKPHDPEPKLGKTSLGKVDPEISQPQDHESRATGLNDVPENSWLRGYGDTNKMHPHFDGGREGKAKK
jgi:hypothetical protein